MRCTQRGSGTWLGTTLQEYDPSVNVYLPLFAHFVCITFSLSQQTHEIRARQSDMKKVPGLPGLLTLIDLCFPCEPLYGE